MYNSIYSVSSVLLIQISLTQFVWFNPLGPHDALKHHFTSLNTQLISLQLGVLGGKLP